MTFNPVEGVPAPALGELVTRILGLRQEKLDIRLAPKRPDLWGRTASWEIECLRDLPNGSTLQSLVRSLQAAEGARNLGIVITLRTDDGEVVCESDTLSGLLDSTGLAQ